MRQTGVPVITQSAKSQPVTVATFSPNASFAKEYTPPDSGRLAESVAKVNANG